MSGRTSRPAPSVRGDAGPFDRARTPATGSHNPEEPVGTIGRSANVSPSTLHVLLPFDGSDGAAEVLHHASGIAHWTDATIHGLDVADTARDSAAAVEGRAVYVLVREGEDIVEEAEKRSRRSGVPTTPTSSRTIQPGRSSTMPNVRPGSDRDADPRPRGGLAVPHRKRLREGRPVPLGSRPHRPNAARRGPRVPIRERTSFQRTGVPLRRTLPSSSSSLRRRLMQLYTSRLSWTTLRSAPVPGVTPADSAEPVSRPPGSTRPMRRTREAI